MLRPRIARQPSIYLVSALLRCQRELVMILTMARILRKTYEIEERRE